MKSKVGIEQEDIAIVGMSCLFPGAETVSRYWQNIVNKTSSISEAPPDWQPERFFDPSGGEPDRSYINRGGFLGDLSRFDPAKFGVPPSSVEGAEPDHFIALRCAHEALSDANVPELPINRDRTGVIIGRGLFINRGWASVFQRTFVVDQVVDIVRRLEPEWRAETLSRLKEELKRGLPPVSAESVPGLVHSALVGRIANRLNLRGPAFTVDAACSSALLAVELGMRHLRSGDCDAVLVGGSQVSTPATIHIMFCYLNALSPTGTLAPFSAAANGTLLGQGCGMLVLKRRKDAERDGNRIYALLKSIGVSSDGRGAGLLAPLSEGQQLAISRAYEPGSIGLETVGLVEAHGTGIPLGDRTELESLGRCFPRTDNSQQPIALGAVKSMIGHLLPAAGIASLIKTAAALYQRVLPPTLHAEEPHPELQLKQTRFFLCNEARPWLHSDRRVPRRAGVNAFGFGGINAHAVLEEHPADETQWLSLEQEWPAELVVLSATNRQALVTRARALIGWLEQSDGVRLIDVAASCASEEAPCRMAIVARDCGDLITKLEHAVTLLREPARTRIQDRHGIYWYEQPLRPQGRIAFVFPGEGAQYPNMLQDLCRHFPEVRREFDLTAAALQQRRDGPLLGPTLYPQPGQQKQVERDLYRLEIAVATVTAASRGLLALLKRLQVLPDAVVGHSSGEFGALLGAGAYRPEDEEDAIRSIVLGADSARELETSGLVPPAKLLAVGGADPAAVEKVIADHEGALTVAMDNCPSQIILAGSEEAIETAIGLLRTAGGLCQRLAWERAYHTDAFAPVCPLIERFFSQLRLRSPEAELWSCATAAPFPQDPSEVQELAIRQWRSPVRFRETITAMYRDGVRLFVEVGPRGNLAAFISDTLADQEHMAVSLDVHRKPGVVQLCHAVGMLAAQGVRVDLMPLFAKREPRSVNFAAPAQPAEPAQPRLRLELPVMTLSEAAASELRGGDSPGQPGNDPAPHSADGNGVAGRAAKAAPSETPSPTPAPPSAPDRLRPRKGSATLETSHQTQAASHHGGGDRRTAALVDFQATMQQFLDVQQAVMAARGARQPPSSDGRPTGDSATAHYNHPQDGSAGVRTPRRAEATSVLRQADDAAVTADATASDSWPFVQKVLEHEPGRRVMVECELDVAQHRFLQDHTFFGRGLSTEDSTHQALAIMPLAMTLELMAESATLLHPGVQVTAFSEIVTSRWLAFETPRRIVRIEAEVLSAGLTRVAVHEADRGEQSGQIACAIVEHHDLPRDLGPAKLATCDEPRPSWDRAELYGRILYHGPAFEGIELVHRCGPSGLSAQVRCPDPTRLLANGRIPEMVIPAVLVDVASQLPGLSNFRRRDADGLITLAFPNTAERLEFVSTRIPDQPLLATVRCSADEKHLFSDVEFTTADGQVVLRYLGRVEEIVHFPRGPYAYAKDPRRELCSRPITDLFIDVPGIEACVVTEAARLGDQLLLRSLWSEVLARMALDASEQVQWREGGGNPIHRAGQLLARIAAKDAVRLLDRLSVCLADVRIVSNDNGRPTSAVGERPGPHVSLAHKGLYAVAAASGNGVRAGVDVEPIENIDPHVIADAFDEMEREILKHAPHGFVFGWTAKEAISKALGLGLAGGPRCIRLTDVDSTGTGMQVHAVLSGTLADALPEYAGGSDATNSLQAACRLHGEWAIALCLLSTHSLLSTHTEHRCGTAEK